VKIGPVNNTIPPIGDKQETANKTNQDVEKEKVKGDQLDISNRARELQINSKTTSEVYVDIENNSQKKLNLIRLKISKGFYDKPQIKTKIAEKLATDKAILREYYKSVF